MKKNPGRKERRALAKRNHDEVGKFKMFWNNVRTGMGRNKRSGK